MLMVNSRWAGVGCAPNGSLNGFHNCFPDLGYHTNHYFLFTGVVTVIWIINELTVIFLNVINSFIV